MGNKNPAIWKFVLTYFPYCRIFYKFECAFETHSVMLFSKLYHNSYNSSFKILFTIPGFALPFIAFMV